MGQSTVLVRLEFQLRHITFFVKLNPVKLINFTELFCKNVTKFTSTFPIISTVEVRKLSFFHVHENSVKSNESEVVLSLYYSCFHEIFFKSDENSHFSTM